jgi:hypothetical protein
MRRVYDKMSEEKPPQNRRKKPECRLEYGIQLLTAAAEVRQKAGRKPRV